MANARQMGSPPIFKKKSAKKLAPPPLLLPVFEESVTAGSLTPTMRQAVLSLIPKKEKDPLECSSFHPISLLNVESKIPAKMLALRLEKVLPSLIEDQLFVQFCSMSLMIPLQPKALRYNISGCSKKPLIGWSGSTFSII